MSEGPEVKRVAQMLASKLTGDTILEIEAHHKAILAVLASDPRALVGRRVVGVTTRGKHILVELDSGALLHNHLLMFGSWRVFDLDTPVPPDPRNMEVIRTDRHHAVLRGASVLELLESSAVGKHRSLSRLGPDVLHDDFDPALAIRNLRLHPDIEIGVALLDQEILAGLGNYLKSEILFLTRINPRTLIRDLTPMQLREIVEQSRQVSQFAFHRASYTVPPEIQARLDEQGMSPFTVGRRHWVFRRTNKPCWVCGTPIRQFRQGEGHGRITYACPTCQRLDTAPRPRRAAHRSRARAMITK